MTMGWNNRDRFDPNDGNGGGGETNIDFTLSNIPEPSTLLLLAPALLGIAGVLLKRRK